MKRVIVQVIQHLAMGGIEKLVLELQRKAEPGDEVHIVSLEGRHESSADLVPGISSECNNLHFIHKQPGVHFAAIVRLYKLLSKLNPTVVHTHHIGPLLYGGIAARLARVPFIIHTEHDAWHLRDQRRRKIERWALKMVSPHLVADAKLVARHLRDRIPGVKPVVIHNGIDIELFAPGSRYEARTALGLPSDVKIVGCAARMTTVKNHEVLLDAFFWLPTDVHLALAGDGPLNSELHQQAKELGIEERVHFLGNQSNMPLFYQAIDLFCLTSKNEGMPLSPLEAQACGKPVVLTDVGGCSEAVCPHTGMLVEAGDKHALIHAIKLQLRAPSLKNPRSFVEKGKALTHMVRAYNQIVEPGRV
ncbi:glycosyltransferase [Pseudomonadota bacterium]